jgi:hypothetical protein
MKMLIRSLGLSIARSIGAQIKDFESGKSLGRAIIIPWRGKIHVIGLQAAVRPMFLPQKRITYWKQELGFTTHPPPDFPGGIENTAETGPPTSEH